jgi:alginate O-acetyltransferase complex protein AlgI
MNIASITFSCFVLAVLVVYYLLSRRSQNILLLVASYIFYATWSLTFPLLLLGMTIVNFGLSKHLRTRPAPKRRPWLWLGIGFNVSILAVFKFADFYVNDITEKLASLGIDHTAGLRIILPIGLSFYVLQAISYLIDVSREQIPTDNFIDFGLYIAYFPKLTAGPIERARTFMPQLKTDRIVDNEQIARSCVLILVGLVRKLILADALANLIPDNYFTQPGTMISVDLLSYALAYSFWLYNDFAGYTSIVRGVSGLFGINLSPNFQQPYFARNFTEFWNRWHITLSMWLRDYIYFPLSRTLLRRNNSRWNLWNIFIPPMITMILSGLWHGVGWHMILWGGLHGTYLVAERLLSLTHPTLPPQKQPRWRQAGAMVVVLIFVTAAWIPFSMSVLHAGEFFRRLTLEHTLQMPSLRIISVILVSALIDWFQYRRGGNEYVFLQWPQLAQAALLALILLVLFLAFLEPHTNSFLYQGF